MANHTDRGIILSEDGYIATNAHVIEDADSLEVVLNDGTTYQGVVVGYDTKTDLAVVKIDATAVVFKYLAWIWIQMKRRLKNVSVLFLMMADFMMN